MGWGSGNETESRKGPRGWISDITIDWRQGSRRQDKCERSVVGVLAGALLLTMTKSGLDVMVGLSRLCSRCKRSHSHGRPHPRFHRQSRTLGRHEADLVPVCQCRNGNHRLLPILPRLLIPLTVAREIINELLFILARPGRPRLLATPLTTPAGFLARCRILADMATRTSFVSPRTCSIPTRPTFRQMTAPFSRRLARAS